ncbi:MAG: hypothetical protein CMO55_18260 [Verrucomicrobiales bacterium]|nr:hypothetical protein [Verrucomicrobiales bacterium]
MKQVILIAGIALIVIVIALLVGARIVGPRMISVAPPKGEPIGKFDLPRPETSILAVDIVVPMTMLEEIANTKVPPEIEGADNKSFHKRVKDGKYAWKVVRGDVDFENQGDKLAFKVPFQGAAKFAGDLDAKILTLPLEGNAELGGMATGTLNPQILPDWKIEPNLVPNIQLSKAALTFGQLGKIDISSLLGSSLGQYLQKETRKLTPALKKGLNLRKEVNKLWGQAYFTEQISDDPKVWLKITPQQLLLGPLDYSKAEQISVSVAIQSETFLVNREPVPATPAPLPNLRPVDSPIDTNLQIPIIISMQELNQVLENENIDLDTGIGTQVKVTGMKAEVGQNGFLNIGLNIQADKSRIGRGVAGQIWVQGKPIIDLDNQTLGFSEVALTVETKDSLTSAATWLLEGFLVKGIESQLRVDLDDYKEELNEEVLKAIDNAKLPEGIDVSVQNLDIRLADIYTITRHFEEGEPDPGIVIVVQATGDMDTSINQLILQSPEDP